MFGMILFASLLDEVFQLCQRRHARHFIFSVAFVFKGERGGWRSHHFDSQIDPISLPVYLKCTKPNIADATIPLATKFKWHKRSFQGYVWGSVAGHATSRTLRIVPNVRPAKNKHNHKHRYQK